jgi:aldose 1-epimerase
LRVPDRRCKLANVTLGFDNLDDYVQRGPCFGCITGRYANRIALGTFTLDGVINRLPRRPAPQSTSGSSASQGVR